MRVGLIRMCPFFFSGWVGAQVTFLNHSPLLDSVHPDYALHSILPDGYANKIIGMDWLPDGEMVLLAMQDSVLPQSGGGHGWVHILKGAQDAPARATELRTIYYGFENPMGLAVADSQIFISQRETLVRLRDANWDGHIDSLTIHAAFPNSARDGGFGRWSMNLRYRDGFFYTGLGAYHFIEGDGPCLPWADRGTVHVVDRNGKAELWGRGLREPNGVGFGPGGELFATDNDGEWVASNKLVHIRKDAFYGLVPCRQWDPSLRFTLPAIWFPQHLRSPGQPLLLTEGAFQGQMVVGDYVVRNLSRIFLEKVNGEFQGALFPFTGGLASGALRLLKDEQGAIYIGEMTIESYEAWYVSAENRPAPGALEKLAPKPVATSFEMLAIRAKESGFEIEFTKPVAAAAADPASYRIRQWRLESTSNYGSDKLELETLVATVSGLSEDGRKVALTIPQLKPGRIIHFQLNDGFVGAQGEKPWSYHAWYTLNAIPGVLATTVPFSPHIQASDPAKTKVEVRFLLNRSRTFSVTAKGDLRIQLFDVQGRQLWSASTVDRGEWKLDADLKPGYYLIRIQTPQTSQTQGWILP
jgi:hypothetical protein